MADETGPEPTQEKKKGGKKGLIIGIMGALLAGGGGFYASYEGLILGPDAAASEHGAESDFPPLPEIAFVALEPMVVSLGGSANARFLRFSAQLDVTPESKEAVVMVLPRIVDVLNTYLRAVSEDELGKPAGLERLRAQMLRRIQVVTEKGQVRDLLITEFVLG
ncbi:MAG: flagellar basal body-associated FliL family protein [Rhodobacteraceae bacterium]|nr:flagellar basal body-associated FliL family protein [Paracoccaceae bacterium]